MAPSALRWLPPLLLVGLVIWFYASTTANPFASDDYLLIQTASDPGEAIRYQGSYHYYPAGMALLAAGHRLWGLDPAGYHWAGILLLALTGLLTAALGRQLGLGSPARWA